MKKRLKRACEICGEPGAVRKRVTRSYGSGRSLLLIENVPVISCPHCGETYLEADTMHELERLKTHRRALASKRTVPVVAFGSC
jgi:YgiT-type zinc finger domain-containing protein